MGPRPGSRVVALVSLLPIVAIVAALVVLPFVAESPYALHVMILLFLAVIQGAAWNVLGGFTGQYSVGHAAYFGLGAYVTLMLLQFRHVPPWWGMWVAIVLAVVLALVIGAITFRLRGPYFVLASIAVTEILRLIALNWKSVTNGAEGILVAAIPPLQIGSVTLADFGSKVPFYYAGLILAALTVAVNWAVLRSKLGYYFQAIREDQDAAHSLGIRLTVYKNVALVISAVFTAWSGALYALYIGFIDPPAVLAVEVSVQFVLICIIGGIGTVVGPVLGAIVIVPLAEALRANLLSDALIRLGVLDPTSPTGAFLKENLAHAHALIYGVLVVVVILFMPEGVVGFARRLWRRRAARAAPAEAAARSA